MTNQKVTTTKFFENKRVKETILAYLMMAPDIIGLLFFVFIPVLIAFYISLHDWNALQPMKFAGLKNYINLMSDSEWWGSLKTTFIYSLMFVPMLFIGSLLLAVFVNSIPGKSQEYFRTAYFIPYSVSTVVAAVMWLFMFDQQKGFINHFFLLLGLSKQKFLGDSKEALICIAIISAWMQIGYYTIIFLAAIKDIPRSYYEAAELDGANAFSVFYKITFPLIREVSSFVLIVTTVYSFQIFDQVKILTRGGPGRATEVSVYYIYTQCFEFMKLGYSSALAFILFIILFVLSLIQLRVTKGNSYE